MSKNAGKNTRAAIGAGSDVNKMDDAEKSRMAIGSMKRLDASQYLRMDIYKEKQLFWENTDGGVDKWIGLGAQPVPAVVKGGQVYKGINDRTTSEYVIVPSVSVDGSNITDAVLLFMDREEYQRLRIDPLTVKNNEIRHAMGIGLADTGGERVMPGVTGLKTYAPAISADKVGLEVRQSGQLTHDV